MSPVVGQATAQQLALNPDYAHGSRGLILKSEIVNSNVARFVGLNDLCNLSRFRDA